MGEGPILLFKQPKQDSKHLALYLFDPTKHKAPQLLWQDDYHPNPSPIRRISSRLLLLEFKSQLHLLDIPTGRLTALLPETDDMQELVSVEPEAIFMLRNTVETRAGYKLKTGQDGKTLVKEYPEPRKLLYRFGLGAKQDAQQVSAVHIQKVLEITEDGFLVITDEPSSSVAVIGRDGTIKKIATFDSSWVAVATTHLLSPDRNHLALGILTLEQDFHQERSLMVYDLGKKALKFQDANVPLGPNLFRGRSMFLDLRWEDESQLRYGGPFSNSARLVEVRKGKMSERELQGVFQPNVKAPEREKRGYFDLAFGEVYYTGTNFPAGSVLDESGVSVRGLAVDATGNWAAYCGQNDALYLIDGKKRQKRVLHLGWAHDLIWMDKKEAGNK